MNIIQKVGLVSLLNLCLISNSLARSLLCDSDGYYYPFSEGFLPDDLAPINAIFAIMADPPSQIRYGILVQVMPDTGTNFIKYVRAGDNTAYIPENTHGYISIYSRSHNEYIKNVGKSAILALKERIKKKELISEYTKVMDSSFLYQIEYSSSRTALEASKPKLLRHSADGGVIYYNLNLPETFTESDGKYSMTLSVSGGVKDSKLELTLKGVGLKASNETPTFSRELAFSLRVAANDIYEQEATKERAWHNQVMASLKCN